MSFVSRIGAADTEKNTKNTKKCNHSGINWASVPEAPTPRAMARGRSGGRRCGA